MENGKQIILSICIPTYNRGLRVFETVQEILSSYKEDDIEIVVVDDCSMDGTIELLKQIEDKRLRIIHNEVRLGQVNNQFYALWCGEGKYVKVLIDRDKIYVNRIKSFMQKLYKYNSAIIFEGCPRTEHINSENISKKWYKLCTRTHPSSLTYLRSALHSACNYKDVVTLMEYKDTPYVYFPSVINVLLYHRYGTSLHLGDSYIYQCAKNTISGNYYEGGTEYYRESGAEKRFALYCRIGVIDKYKREAISLYAGELRNATLWNWESNEEIKKRTGVRTKTIKEILKDNSLFYKYSHFFFSK